MKNEDYNMNIPSCTVSQIIEQLVILFSGAVKASIPLKQMPSVFLWGTSGIGKSSAIYQLAAILSKETGKEVHVIDIRLLLYSPVDLKGVPTADSNRKFTNWLIPQMFDMDPSPGVIQILFLDELSAAPPSVQAASYQITLDRKVGEHALPDNCIVIAAGNRTTDQSVAYKMPKALANRLLHYNVVSDFYSWKEWALGSAIDRRIIGYLSFDRSQLCVSPESSDLAYPTPRSWSFVDKILKVTPDLPLSNPYVHELISACIGKDAATSFGNWCEVYEYLPDIEDIIHGNCRDYPKTQDALYALSTSLEEVVRSRGETLTLFELDNICLYVSRFSTDFALAFFHSINRIEPISLRLMKCRSLQNWLSKNKRSL